MSLAANLDALTAQINAAPSCATLQAAATQAIATLTAQLAGMEAEVAAMLPMLALLDIPDTPAAAVTWISNFITAYLTPQLAPYAKLVLQVTELTAAIASLTAAITSKASSFENCTITI
jgi:hypothetical protein